MSTRSAVDPVAADAPADPRLVRELARRCEERLDALVDRVMAEWNARLPGYQSLRDAGHVAAVRQTIRFFLRTAQGAAADEDLRQVFRTRAAYRAEQGVPLVTLLRTYTIAAQALFEGLRQEVRDGESAAFTEVARLLLSMQDEAITEVARAYQEELAALGAARRDRRRELVRDLIAGGPLPDAAALEELGLDAGAAVLAIRLGKLVTTSQIPQQSPPQSPPSSQPPLPSSSPPQSSPQSSSSPLPPQSSPPSSSPLPSPSPSPQSSPRSQPPPSPQSTPPPAPESTAAGPRIPAPPDLLEPAFSAFEVATRRRLLRLQQALDGHFARPVPALLEQAGGHALVPGASPPVSAELAARLIEVWGDETRVAVAVADRPERIGQAAATASEVLRLVCALGRPPGVYTLDDVLLEYHLTRQNESAHLLGALLEPLSARPDLLQTVRVFLEEQYDRRRTARRLGLHPNTVDNRLSRVTELTGLDPATPRGVALLMTALALQDLG